MTVTTDNDPSLVYVPYTYVCTCIETNLLLHSSVYLKGENRRHYHMTHMHMYTHAKLVHRHTHSAHMAEKCLASVYAAFMGYDWENGLRKSVHLG